MHKSMANSEWDEKKEKNIKSSREKIRQSTHKSIANTKFEKKEKKNIENSRKALKKATKKAIAKNNGDEFGQDERQGREFDQQEKLEAK